MIKATIVVQEVNKNFPKVYLWNFLRIIIPLKKRYYHQEESVRAETSEVRIVQGASFQKLLQNQNQRLDYLIFFQILFHHANTLKSVMVISHLCYINAEWLIKKAFLKFSLI